MAFRTRRAVSVEQWPHGRRFDSSFTLPAGTALQLVPGLDGMKGDGFAVASVALLVELTGDSHDPVYRYCKVSAGDAEGDTPEERAAIERVAAAWAE